MIVLCVIILTLCATKFSSTIGNNKSIKRLIETVNTILREELQENLMEYSLAFREYGISSALNIHVFEGNKVLSEVLDRVPYVNLPFYCKIYTRGNVVQQSPKVEAITGIRRYFETLKTTTGGCRKLARFGGESTCRLNLGDENGMDGNKLICMDPDFEVGSRKFPPCLVLSFGVHVDTSFDECIADLNCQVHMFDMDNYRKEYLEKDKKIYFHQVGLAAKRYRLVNTAVNVSTDYDTLLNIATDLGLQNQLIHILKIDIEGQEWEVLHDLSSQDFLHSIGQIAVEVHSMDLLKLSYVERLKKAQYWIRAIEALEARGFRRVAYWDNINPRFDFTDIDGTRFSTAGELLLVNYNWYNKTFKTEVRKVDSGKS